VLGHGLELPNAEWGTTGIRPNAGHISTKQTLVIDSILPSNSNKGFFSFFTKINRWKENHGWHLKDNHDLHSKDNHDLH
jgi:hypothetical protein